MQFSLWRKSTHAQHWCPTKNHIFIFFFCCSQIMKITLNCIFNVTYLWIKYSYVGVEHFYSKLNGFIATFFPNSFHPRKKKKEDDFYYANWGNRSFAWLPRGMVGHDNSPSCHTCHVVGPSFPRQSANLLAWLPGATWLASWAYGLQGNGSILLLMGNGWPKMSARVN